MKQQPQLNYYNIGPDVVAFSTTRHGGCSKGQYAAFNINRYCGDSEDDIRANREALCQTLGIADNCLVMPHQVHDMKVAKIDEAFLTLNATERQEALEGVDALMTNLKGLCIGVSTADCIPVLLYDKEKQAVCSIHAGWRGTVARITEKAVAEMQAEYATRPEQLIAQIGPGIHLDSFEVGDEVYDAFEQAGFDMPAISVKKEKWHIDLPECNRQQLIAAGLEPQNVKVSPVCTFQQANDYFSARRLGINSGRIFTGILMKMSVFLICLLTACQMPETTPNDAVAETAVDSAAIYQDRAYEEMFNGSLAKAETYAYRAFLMSRDSTMECSALSLLGYIYYREGKQEELQLLMQTISPTMYTNMMDVQSQVEQAKAGRRQLVYVVAIIVLVGLFGSLGFWYVHRTRAQTRLYQQRIDSVRQKLEISETKVGIDVLHAIINDQNISQMGKHEEQAVLKTLPMVDEALAEALSKTTSPLTPKETFFCIMEYYGKTDHQKARSFCCSEQAVRSTKSRLGKKMDISVLRSE